ncbi:MAG: hypothetical protein ACC662_08620, partial [Planctomycetota bacterium]
VTKEIEEEVWQNRRVPPTKERRDPCTGEITTIPCGSRNERVFAGKRKRTVFDHYEPEEREIGWSWERVETGKRTKKVFAGWRWARAGEPASTEAAPQAAQAEDAPGP